MSALLGCPFCGIPGEPYPDGEEEGYSVMCFNSLCHGMASTGGQTQAEANENWNRRVTPAVQTTSDKDAVIERCAKACENEYLIDPTDSVDDCAYQNAVADCAAAIRKLKS